MVPIRIRPATPADAGPMALLFYETVRSVIRGDYAPAQIEAWAPRVLPADQWIARQKGRTVDVATEKDRVVGFGELEPDGYIDCFYVHKDRQRVGIGTLLLSELERRARASGVKRLFAEVSLTARTFFERREFLVLREQQVVHRGVAFTNCRIEKPAGPGLLMPPAIRRDIGADSGG